MTINQLAAMVMDIAGKKLEIEHIPRPLGVRGRNSDNRLIKSTLGWARSQPLDGRSRKDLRLKHRRRASGAATRTAASPRPSSGALFPLTCSKKPDTRGPITAVALPSKRRPV